MATSDAPKPVSPYISGILKVLATYNVAFPLAAEAVMGIISLFRGLHPGTPLPTDAEAFAALKAVALEKRAEEDEWLRAHGG